MPYSPTNWVEGVTTLGPTNMNKIETELAYLDARIAPAALAYGTTLPGSPVDGQEAILVDSTTNPSYQWRFRYNAGSSSAYKWEFVGGAPWSSYVVTSETTTSAAWVELATTQRFTVPRAGDWDFLAHSEGSATTSGDTVGMGISPDAFASWVDYQFATIFNANGATAIVAMGRAAGLAAATIVRLGFIRPFGASTAAFARRSYRVQPVRVS
jgi:hypothetical protein